MCQRCATKVGLWEKVCMDVMKSKDGEETDFVFSFIGYDVARV